MSFPVELFQMPAWSWSLNSMRPWWSCTPSRRWRCDYTAPTKQYVNTHKKVHDGQKLYSCDPCEHQTTTLQYLNAHKQVKHEGLEHCCDQCPAEFNQARSLTTHKKVTHNEGVMDFCDKCDAQFAHHYLLIEHIE